MLNIDEAAILTSAELRVSDALRRHKLATKVIVLTEMATTAQMAADALNVGVGQIVKSLCFMGADSAKPYFVMVSGDNRVHERRVGKIVGEKLKRADADFVKLNTGFSIGGVSPFGHPFQLNTYFDEHLLGFETVWAAAGNPRSVFEISPHDLLRASGAKSITVT